MSERTYSDIGRGGGFGDLGLASRWDRDRSIANIELVAFAKVSMAHLATKSAYTTRGETVCLLREHPIV